MQIYWTKINKIIDQTSEIKTYLLDCPEGFTWEEGAHTHFALKGFNAGEKPNKGLVRHMSISTLPSENAIGITTRIKENCSEFKSILNTLQIGDEVALFKTHSNVQLKRVNKKLYLLSSGVGIATFRPLVLTYMNDSNNINSIHSLNIDSSEQYLFTEVFQSIPEKNFTAHYVNKRQDYYEAVQTLPSDQDGLYYVVGSDEFIIQTINTLREKGITPEQIVLDKHQQHLDKFFNLEASI